MRGGVRKTFQHVLVFGVLVVFLGALSLLHIIFQIRLFLISHKWEKLLFSVPHSVYLDVICTAIIQPKAYVTFSPMYPAFPCVYKTLGEMKRQTPGSKYTGHTGNKRRWKSVLTES